MKTSILTLICIFFYIQGNAQVDLNKGLVLYLPFNGDTKDKSIYGNDAVNFGATPTTDEYGRPNCAYRFNGTTNYMEIPHSPSLNITGKEISMSMRVQPLGYYPGFCHASVLIGKGYDGQPGNYCIWYTPAQNGDCSVQDTSHQVYSGFYNNELPSFSTIDNAPYIRTKKWDCLVFSSNGSIANMYVNGTLRHSFPVSGVVGTNTTSVTLGATLRTTTYPYWLNGDLDEVRVYNRVLTTPEIDSLCKIRSFSTGIEESVYSTLPILINPSKDFLVMTLDEQNFGGELSVSNINGVKILNITNLRENKVDLTQLAAGMYVVEYKTDRFIFRNRFVKID
jgi:hypothetical protein